MMGKTSGEPYTPFPPFAFFDLIACPWDMLGHATSHIRSLYYPCEVPHAIQRPGKSYYTTQLTIPHPPPPPPPPLLLNFPKYIFHVPTYSYLFFPSTFF